MGARLTSGEGPGANATVRPWREHALERLLTVVCALLPILFVSLTVLRTPPSISLLQVVVFACAILLFVLRFSRIVPFRPAAWLSIGALYVPALLALFQYGLMPGPSVVATVAVVLAAIYFSRSAALVLLGATVLAYLTAGWLVSRGDLTLSLLVDTDPLIFRNWVRVTITVGLMAGFLAVSVRYLVDTLEKHYESALRADRDLRTAYEQLGQLHRRIESAKEDERRFLAHELHDEFGQTLTALKLRFQMLGRTTIAPDVGPQVLESVSLVDGLIDRVRRISLDLRPPLLDEVGLAAALRAYIDAQLGHSSMAIALTVTGLDDRLPREVEMACYRIVQEAITNVLRHAGAKSAAVRVEYSKAVIEIAISDDGAGFVPGMTGAGPGAGSHLGVVGMRERARALGGEFSLASRPGSGTSIFVRLPVTESAST